MSQEITNEVLATEAVLANEATEEKMVAFAEQVAEALEESTQTGKTEEVIEKLEEAIRASGNAEILDMVKQNQELFEIANSLLFRAVGLAAKEDTDVFIVNVQNGVLFLTEEDYTTMMENSSEHIKVQIGQHYPEADLAFINEKYEDYVAQTTLKYINKEEAKKYSEAIGKRFGQRDEQVEEVVQETTTEA